ncbi:MAG: PH domain-containing protein [bacterium]
MLSKKHLPHQEADEHLVIFLRRHWFIALKIVLFFALLAILPFALYFILQTNTDLSSDNNVKSVFLTIGASVYYLFIWLFFFYALLDFYLDIWIVTNKRIISIEQHGLFARTIAEQRLSRVQDATSEVKGLFPTFLNYGDVHIQTAGEVSRFVFKQVPNAREVAKHIIVLADKRKLKEGNGL